MTVWRHASAKLNPVAVRAIRKLRLGGASLRKIAKLYGVSHNAIWLLGVGSSWKHVK
jgi:transposase